MKAKALFGMAVAACTLIVSVAPVYAASDPSKLDGIQSKGIDDMDNMEQTITVGEAKLKVPTIKVTVPTTAKFSLNPYKLDVLATAEAGHEDILYIDTNTKKDNDGNLVLKEQIASPIYQIINESDVPIKAGVKAFNGTATNADMTLGSYSETSKNKAATVYVELADKVATLQNSSYDKDNANQTILNKQLSSVRYADFDIPKVTAASGSTPAKAGYGYLQFRGSINMNATDAYAAEDTITVSEFTLTLKPVLDAQ